MKLRIIVEVKVEYRCRPYSMVNAVVWSSVGA